MICPRKHGMPQRVLSVALLLSSLLVSPAVGADEGLTWHTRYDEAVERAKLARRMLLVYFREDEPTEYRTAFETQSLADPQVLERLKSFELCRLSVHDKIQLDDAATRLIDHEAFAELHGHEGLAVIDLVNRDEEHFRQVVSVLPFVQGKYYRFDPAHVSVLLTLPSGTLTQRTMVFAVRIHPEAPQSTAGEVHPELSGEAAHHSDHQARIEVQGHHNWDSRFQRITAKLPRGLLAQEVVAESWPRETLLDAAVDCVHSWRQSSGHWGAVRARQPFFGYDIRLGRNGIWYATGLFGNRH